MIDVLSLDKTLFQKVYAQDVFCFLKQNYLWKYRLSGEPWYYHPFRMMKEIVAEWIYDAELLLWTLLHDILEDTDISCTEFESLFGSQIFTIVDWLSNLDVCKNKMKKSDYFLKFRSSIHAEWRILFIKLFDCLDNLRTIEQLPWERQINFKEEKRSFYLEVFRNNVSIIPSLYRDVFLSKIDELNWLLDW